MLIPPRSIATEGIGMVDSPNVSPSNEAMPGGQVCGPQFSGFVALCWSAK